MCRPRAIPMETTWRTTPRAMAFTTVMGMRPFAQKVVAPALDAARSPCTVGTDDCTDASGGGEYIVGRGGIAAAPRAPTATGTGARVARSKRARQRGHHEGSPVRRAPQLGHWSIPGYF